jgi:Flp pilus assembly protein TadD
VNDRHRNLYHQAAALMGSGKMPEAEPILRALLLEDPNFGDALNLLGVIAISTHRPALADECLSKAVAINPTNTEWLGNYAQICMMRGDYAKGTLAARKLLEIDPNSATALGALGGALSKAGDFEEAVACLERAVAVAPNSNAWLRNLGTLYFHVGRYDECERVLLKCLAAGRDDAAAFVLSECLLLRGDFQRGWIAYEGRFGAVGMLPPRHQHIPAWKGEDLGGRTILLWSDQALGDTIQFVRFARSLRDRGASVVLECNAVLKPLFERCDYLAAVRGAGEPLPRVDLQIPLGSLPRLLSVTQETIPAPNPYINAEPKTARRWSEKLKTEQNLPKVGLVWAGNPNHSRDKERSIPLDQFMAIAQTPGVNFYSLQVGPAANLPLPANVTTLSNALKTWDETAGVLANLDLLITVDTAIAHLAGATNRPVWTLITFVPDWRWLLNRSDSPWYPSMKLFRQPSRCDWAPVISAVTADLRNFAQRGK